MLHSSLLGQFVSYEENKVMKNTALWFTVSLVGSGIYLLYLQPPLKKWRSSFVDIIRPVGTRVWKWACCLGVVIILWTQKSSIESGRYTKSIGAVTFFQLTILPTNKNSNEKRAKGKLGEVESLYCLIWFLISSLWNGLAYKVSFTSYSSF